MDFHQQLFELPVTFKFWNILITSREMDLGTFQGLNHAYTSHAVLIVIGIGIVIFIVIDKTNDEASVTYNLDSHSSPSPLDPAFVHPWILHD